MGFLRRLLGGSSGNATKASDGWLLEPKRDDAVLDIVGEASYQEALLRLAGPLTPDGPSNRDHLAVLVAEPDNRYDANAIRVEIDAQCIGYLSRENAMLYGPVVKWALDQAHYLVANARLTGGFSTGRGEHAHIGVILHIGTPSETLMELMGDAITLRTDHRWAGSVIAFTGDSRCRVKGFLLDRPSSIVLAERAGLTVHPRVTKKVALLVDCDPSGMSGNEAKAHDYGIEVVAEAEFWTELGLDFDRISWGPRR